MNKRKRPDQILGVNIWDIEIEHLVNVCELDPIDARAWVIIRWMHLGDLGPLAAAINEDGVLDKAVLINLARLIDEGRITGKRRTPFHPATATRKHVAKLIYDYQIDKGKTHTEALALTARMIGRGEESVKGARKPKGKKVGT
jgi:hypothetical protein